MTTLDDITRQINFDTIPIQYPLIPYDDISAYGTYGRRLLVPDDILPTISALSGKAPSKPRLVTVTEDGYVNVNLAANSANVASGGGGGGSGVSPVKMTCAARDTYNTGGVGGPLNLGGSIPGPVLALYGFSCAWWYNFTPGNTIPLGNLRFYISDTSETTIIHLCRFGVSRNNFTADNGPPWETGEEQTIMFPVPVDGTSWPDTTALFIRANGDLINVNVSATIWYLKGP